MEYLTTYGWAILIIAIVMAAMFSLGVFNPYTFAPKATAGSCQVLRSGSGYTTLIGTCTNQIPQSVASFIKTGSININSLKGIQKISSTAGSSITITVWASVPSADKGYLFASYHQLGYPLLKLATDQWCAGTKGLIIIYVASSILYDNCIYPVNVNHMEFYTFVFNGMVGTEYQGNAGQLYSASFTAVLGSNTIPPDS